MLGSLSLVGGGNLPGTSNADNTFKGKLFNFQYYSGSLPPALFPSAVQECNLFSSAIKSYIVDFYLTPPGKLIAYESSNYKGPKFMLSGKDHYVSTFADIHLDDLPINIWRYHGIKGLINLNDGALDSMLTQQVTYSLRARITLLDFFKNSVGGCNYVESLISPCKNQWLQNFWYEPMIGFPGLQFGARLTPTCTCSVGVSMVCIFKLEFMSTDSTVASFISFTLSTLFSSRHCN